MGSMANDMMNNNDAAQMNTAPTTTQEV